MRHTFLSLIPVKVAFIVSLCRQGFGRKNARKVQLKLPPLYLFCKSINKPIWCFAMSQRWLKSRISVHMQTRLTRELMEEEGRNITQTITKMEAWKLWLENCGKFPNYPTLMPRSLEITNTSPHTRQDHMVIFSKQYFLHRLSYVCNPHPFHRVTIWLIC